MNFTQLGALALAKCAATDPWFPNGGEAMATAWGEIFAHHQIDPEDLLAGVTRAYIENGSGYRPLPADIVRHARAIRRDRAERMSPDDRRNYEAIIDAKVAAIESEQYDVIDAEVTE